MKPWMRMLMCGAMLFAAPAAVRADYDAGVTTGLLAGDDEFAQELALRRLLGRRGDRDFAGGLLLGRFLSPVERNLRARGLVLARQRRLERQLALERALARERALLEREFFRDELRRRALRGYGR